MENDRRSLTSPLNGAHSPGPVTTEGKARSSRNATTHGLYSQAVLLHHECPEAFAALREDYYQRFAPADQPESDLVDQMIAVTWRLRRIAALESAALDITIDAARPSLDATYDQLDPETRTHFAAETLESTHRSLTGYHRMQNALARQYDRGFRNLRSLRTPKVCRNEPNS